MENFRFIHFEIVLETKKLHFDDDDDEDDDEDGEKHFSSKKLVQITQDVDYLHEKPHNCI